MSTQTDRIEKRILLRAPLSRVWRAISDSQEFGSWFGMKVEGSFRAGAPIRATIVPTSVDEEVAKTQKPYEGIALEIHIERLEPERLFSFRWHPGGLDASVDYTKEPTTLVVFELEPEAGGTRLTVTESGFDSLPLARRAKAFAGNEQGWTAQMKLIEKYLAKSA
jgi:uncharacterized protein YndB with AHSA1/START domain